jgi:hypothetical protein
MFVNNEIAIMGQTRRADTGFEHGSSKHKRFFFQHQFGLSPTVLTVIAYF